MAVRHLAAIASVLIRSGRPADTPTALIEDGSGPSERLVVTTLDRAAQAADDASIRAPAVVIIGSVVAHRSPTDPSASG